ncbi:hypothetical protein RUM43_008386 [Polyplax serrata]|uniref:Transcription cofactor vestigial-like protein 4 n=1 Tax=Polyplax serrata TaxID=468196 RepID=A0AAN8P775_POLSC
MEGEESPLDVLSRAATMVSPPTYDESHNYSNKEMPCAKWRRERRQMISNKVIEAPLDFSTRHSNLKPPPSYDQSIQNKLSRPSVIQSVCVASPTTTKPPNFESETECNLKLSRTQSQEDVCDPAIDEHFRRSLGKEYSSIFSNDNKELSKSINSESDSTGLTVDDHFAKALGDTWTKLKQKENQEKIRSLVKNNNNHLLNFKDLSSGQGDVNLKKKKKNAKEPVLNEKKSATITSGWVKT